ncbi:hypothetical protein G4X40_20340 [Rhodococcus sp. D2-41]|nr:hypothetical protein [Rhodococcus sp. D2-41]MDG3012493.1 hypothetical protein [Rhodococcus sp. D2-41]
MTSWTPAMTDWVDEALSRATPLTVEQLDRVKAAFRAAPAPQQLAS